MCLCSRRVVIEQQYGSIGDFGNLLLRIRTVKHRSPSRLRLAVTPHPMRAA